MTLADARERQRIREGLDQTLVVEAAAGTGKTTALVGRIVAVLAAGVAQVDRIVAVTFTEKAAGELKLRMRTELEQARHDASGEERAYLETALSRLEEAWVGTIHGFCADLLRERSVEAGIDPEFVVMPDPEARRFFRAAFDRWLEETLEERPEGVRRALRRPTGRNDFGPTNRLRNAAWELAEHRDFTAPWQRPPFNRETMINGIVEEIDAFAELSERCARKASDNLYRDTAMFRQLADRIRTGESVGDRDYDGLEAELVLLPRERKFRKPRRGHGTNYGDEVTRASVLEAHDQLVAHVATFAASADADLAALLRDELWLAVERYEDLKKRNGRLDFLDLLVLARDLLRESEPVRAEFQERFGHVFVDEFQDTDPVQAEILLLLAAQDPTERDWRQIDPVPGKLFLVGDPKQSIYRFRRANVGTYLRVRDILVQRGAECLELTTSFRSVPTIQRAVNSAFSEHLDGRGDQAHYVPLSPFREDPQGQPGFVTLPVPKPYGAQRVAAYAIERSLPDAIAAYVAWLVGESGWKVEEGGAAVAIEARHVCLLFRRFRSWGRDVTRDYVEALEARGVPQLLVGGHSFHDREEVETIRTALAAIEWPDDELSVYATLRGSLFAIADEDLFDYRERTGRVHPFRRPEDLPESLIPIRGALESLAKMHRRRNHRPFAETIRELLAITRAHAGFVLRPAGEQALANVLHVAEQARVYEQSGGISFRGFVEQLLDDANHARDAEAPILEEGSDGVRIMTVHKAKGLEFPVVILADLTANLASTRAHRFVDPDQECCALRLGGWSGWAPVELTQHEDDEIERDRAEAVRIAYVAATRARDLLVVPAVGDEPYQRSWLSPLYPAVYPEREAQRDSSPATGCPEFGSESAIERADPLATGGVHPGAHTMSGDFTNVWWDPKTLTLEVPPRFGVRQEDLIARDAPATVIDAGVEHFEAWKRAHDQTLLQGMAPSLRVETITDVAATGDVPDDIRVVHLTTKVPRPGGARFGALVHAVLATVPFEPTRESLREVAELQGRILGATDEEIDAAETLTRRTLEHPLLEQAGQAERLGNCRRETPVTIYKDDGTLLEGVVDLAFLDKKANTWMVIDYKTDAELEGQLDRHRRQVGWYTRAVAEATGQRARGVLLGL